MGESAEKDRSRPVVLFDGVCNLCTGFVQFIIPRDPEAEFSFASLQSEVGKELARDCDVDPGNLETIILIEDGDCYTKSSAALRIARRLGGIYRLAVVFFIVPKFIRDFVYDFIANRRYNWFGKKESCMVPTEDNKSRFLDLD